ncbi:MAG: ATP-dependent Clp protease ATP-binding subunit [Patescibacteria group bacterium]|nr:ATP-dependent Clp protease ATP-binding subunit [Patescibacteria group bacterium]
MEENLELYFKDPRLKMTHLGRFFVRMVFYSNYGIVTAACILALLSPIIWVRWSGVLLLLFLIDFIRHFNKADRSLRGELIGRVNLCKYTAPDSFGVIEYAFDRSMLLGGNFYLYLLKKLSEKKELQQGLKRMDVDLDDFKNKIEDAIRESLSQNKNYGVKEERRENLRKEVEKILKLALSQAEISGNRYITPQDIFSSLSYCDSDGVRKVMDFFNIDPGDLDNALIFGAYYRSLGVMGKLPGTLDEFISFKRPYKVRHRVMNRAWTARPTPFLDQYSTDLTDYAKIESVGFLIGHDKEYGRLVDVISRSGRPNAMLVGEPGVGKETIMKHLAYEITKDQVPPELFDKRVVELNVTDLMTGVELGEIQNRANKIINEVIAAGNIILYIPEVHNLLKMSGKVGLNAADIFLPSFNSSAFSVIATTFPKEFKQMQDSQSNFVDAFEEIDVPDITPAEAMRLLVYESLILEKQFKIIINFNAIKQAVILSSKYFREKSLLTSSSDLLRESLSNAKEREDKILNGDDVINVAQRKISIPLKQAKDVEAQKLLNMEDIIHEKYIDQEEAVKAVARALREYRSGLSRKGGPIATFLFVGPTGVGKTELSKLLANIQFGSESAMIRFDMSEYQDKQSIFRFIGSPDGAMSGNLTDAVNKNPYSLILLDEFEKAHPDILNIFLQVFDDGRLTDNLGKVADFTNTVIIATSNAGSVFIKEAIEKGEPISQISDELKKKLTDYFKPELINRFSKIIVFKDLSSDDIQAIARILLGSLADDLKVSHGIDMNFSDDAVKKISQWGYDPAFGARPLRGVISDKIRSVLAEKILKNEIKRGDNLLVSVKDNELIFEIKNNN